MAGFIARWIAIAAATAAALFPASVTSKQTAYPGHRCASAAPSQPAYNLSSYTVYVGNLPWGLAYLNESIAFAAVNFSIAVLDTTELTPVVLNSIEIGPDLTMGNYYNDDDGYGFRELKLSSDGLNLYIATGYGALILDVERTLQGETCTVPIEWNKLTPEKVVMTRLWGACQITDMLDRVPSTCPFRPTINLSSSVKSLGATSPITAVLSRSSASSDRTMGR
jgi:hypothetical protein